MYHVEVDFIVLFEERRLRNVDTSSTRDSICLETNGWPMIDWWKFHVRDTSELIISHPAKLMRSVTWSKYSREITVARDYAPFSSGRTTVWSARWLDQKLLCGFGCQIVTQNSFARGNMWQLDISRLSRKSFSSDFNLNFQKSRRNILFIYFVSLRRAKSRTTKLKRTTVIQLCKYR